MSLKSLMIAATVSVTALAAVPAVAAQDDDQAKPLPLRAQVLFNLVDVNSDGAIDQAEMATLQRAFFVAIDVDGDGKLTAEEFRQVTAGPRARAAHFMGRGGPQGGDYGPGFHRGPRDNRQGQLEMPGFGMPGMPGPGMTPQMGEGEAGQGAPTDEPRNFASLDTNGDGVVSAEEFAAGAPRLPVFPE